MKFSISLFVIFVFFPIINFANTSKAIIFDEKYSFSLILDIADNFKTRKLGLMHKKRLDNSNGMIFLFNEQKIVNMWMKNTFFDLDIIFINFHTILSIKNGKKLSTSIISSKKPVNTVIEIPKDCSKKLGLKEGKKIYWKKLENINLKFIKKKYFHSFPCIEESKQ